MVGARDGTEAEYFELEGWKWAWADGLARIMSISYVKFYSFFLLSCLIHKTNFASTIVFTHGISVLFGLAH
jgi:hypothetical protein